MQKHEWTQGIDFFAFDTLCSIRIMPYSRSAAAPILKDTWETAHLVEQTLNMFDETSELSCLCNNYAISFPFQASAMLYSFIEDNLRIAALTDGQFDFTVGTLIKLWDFLADNPEVPAKEKIADLLQSVGYQHLSLLPERRSVVIDCKGIQLDPGASGKGFALDKVSVRLRQHHVQHAVLDFGGNIFTIGGKWDAVGSPGGRPWITALRNPTDPGSVIGSVPLVDAGIATSSWYEHCFKKDGEVYYHILNPYTGFPLPMELKSMTIISPSALYSDILSTAFFVLGLEKGMRLAEALKEDIGTIEYVAVTKDDRILSSPGAGFNSAV